MLRRAGWLMVGALLVTLLGASGGQAYAQAQQAKNKGLFITPLREYPTVTPGQPHNGTMTVANLTDKPLTVTLSAQKFSVADYTYDYQFEDAKDDWIKLSATQLQLKPDQSQPITYSIAAPKSAMPGGHYFAIFASASLDSGSVLTKVQVATVLYVTVNGDLHRTGQIQSGHIPKVAFGDKIPFSLNAKDTGNTHFFMYPFGRLQGISARNNSPESAHLLLPGAVRAVGGTIPAPLLPGVYKAVYGYRIDNGATLQQASYVVYLPPWSLAIPAGMILIGLWIRSRLKGAPNRRRLIDSWQRRYK
ncbi:MAG TPA: hypothetical protein VLF60_02105 [Candidatus Saccharimonadales bacterium]|nr:hypothetical protein [Candidatus Saccharimonadales bacterium]